MKESLQLGEAPRFFARDGYGNTSIYRLVPDMTLLKVWNGDVRSLLKSRSENERISGCSKVNCRKRKPDTHIKPTDYVQSVLFVRHQRLARTLAPVSSVDSLDWKVLSASEITQRVTGKVQSDSICLFHNAALHTPEVLPSILDFFQSGGYKVVPISQIIFTGITTWTTPESSARRRNEPMKSFTK